MLLSKTTDTKSDKKGAKRVFSDSTANESSITHIQKFFRAHSARRKYRITHLDNRSQTDYRAFFVGNDPIITGLEQHKQEHTDTSPIAVIGTSVLRSVEIGLQLSKNSALPKIIIIDNSKQVITLWKNLREFASKYTSESDKDAFIEDLSDFLMENYDLCQTMEENFSSLLKQAPSQNVMTYLINLCNKYGFQNLVKTISSTTIIAQDWTHRATFQRLKESLNKLGILNVYMYPSNIILCSKSNQMVILENIRLLKPKLVIHTYDDANRGIPTKTLLLKDSSPDEAIKVLTRFMRYPVSQDIHLDATKSTTPTVKHNTERSQGLALAIQIWKNIIESTDTSLSSQRYIRA